MCFLVTRGVSFGVCRWVSLWGWSLGPTGMNARGDAGGFPLALANTLEVFLGSLGGGEEEAAGHPVERGVAGVFHSENPAFLRWTPLTVLTSTPMGYGRWIWVPTQGLLGGGPVSYCVRGMAPSDESLDSKCHLEVFLSPILVTRGLGDGGSAFAGGGGVPLSQLLHPPNHRPASLPISPHPPPQCTPSAPTFPTPQPCNSAHPSTPPSRPSPAPNPSTPSRWPTPRVGGPRGGGAGALEAPLTPDRGPATKQAAEQLIFWPTFLLFRG